MLNREFLRELTRLLVLGGFGALIGWLLGWPWQGLALAMFIYCCWHLVQVGRLANWLAGDTRLDPPESHGIWTSVLDRLYRLQQAHHAEHEQLLDAANYVSEGVASLSDGVIMVDPDGVIVWCNDATERLVGVRSAKDKGNLLVNLLRDPDFVRYFQRGDFSSGLELASPNEGQRILRIEVTLFGGGNRLVFIRDSTQIYKLEQMRVDFIANVSHELRTPLTVINGYLETLDSMDGEIPAPMLQRALGQMQIQSKRMQSLIDDITLLSRLESEPDSQPSRPIDVAGMVSMMADDARCSIGSGHHFKLRLDASCQLQGEHKTIHSAFGNLVDNACKYSRPGSDICISWRVGEEGGIFEVEDDGPGIDPADIPRLTERFYRADKGRSAASGGTGLGLAIVKHALKRHDARLEVDSTLGKGSVFRCIFPAHRIVRGAELAAR
jgi:two-component system phosphate regulon sensor histidine kinase PhoR